MEDISSVGKSWPGCSMYADDFASLVCTSRDSEEFWKEIRGTQYDDGLTYSIDGTNHAVVYTGARCTTIVEQRLGVIDCDVKRRKLNIINQAR